MGWLVMLLWWVLSAVAAPWPVVLPEGLAFPAPPRSVAWSGAVPAGGAAALSSDGALVLIDGARLLRLEPGATQPTELRADLPPLTALGPHGELAWIRGDAIQRVDPATGAPAWSKPARGATVLQWSAEGTSLALGGNNNITALDARTGEVQEAPDSRTARFVYAATQQRLAHVTGGRLELYDALGAGRLLEAPAGEATRDLTLSPDGRWLAERRDQLRIWDADARRLAVELPEAGAFAFAPDGRLAVARAGHLELRAPGGALVQALPLSRPLTRILWSDTALVLLGPDGARRLPLPAPGLSLNLVAGAVTSAAVHPDGSRVAIGTELGLLQVWSVQGELLAEDHAPGPVRALRWTDEGRALAAMAPGPSRWTGDGFKPCPPNDATCGAASAPTAPAPDPRLDGPLLSSGGDVLVEGLDRAVRLVRPAETLVIWPGPDGAWATLSGGVLRWGGPGPAFLRDGQPIDPPAEVFRLVATATPARAFDGDPTAAVTLRVKNEGPGRAFNLRASAGAAQSAPIGRLDPGQEISIPLVVPPTDGQITLTAMTGAPLQTPYVVSRGAWPLAVKKVKRKGQTVQIQLSSAGADSLGGALYWLSATDRSGKRWAVASGPGGRLAAWAPGQPPPNARDGMVFPAKGKIELEYRLPDKDSRELQLWVQPYGGAPRPMGI